MPWCALNSLTLQYFYDDLGLRVRIFDSSGDRQGGANHEDCGLQWLPNPRISTEASTMWSRSWTKPSARKFIVVVSVQRNADVCIWFTNISVIDKWQTIGSLS